MANNSALSRRDGGGRALRAGETRKGGEWVREEGGGVEKEKERKNRKGEDDNAARDELLHLPSPKK